MKSPALKKLTVGRTPKFGTKLTVTTTLDRCLTATACRLMS